MAPITSDCGAMHAHQTTPVTSGCASTLHRPAARPNCTAVYTGLLLGAIGFFVRPAHGVVQAVTDIAAGLKNQVLETRVRGAATRVRGAHMWARCPRTSLAHCSLHCSPTGQERITVSPPRPPCPPPCPQVKNASIGSAGHQRVANDHNRVRNATNQPQVLHTSTGTCTDKTCLMLGPERHLRHVHLRLLRRPERPVSSSRRQCIRATEEMARKVDQTAVDSSLWRRRPSAGTPAPAVHSRNRRDGTQGGDRT